MNGFATETVLVYAPVIFAYANVNDVIQRAPVTHLFQWLT